MGAVHERRLARHPPCRPSRPGVAGTARPGGKLGVCPRGGRERRGRHLLRAEPLQCPDARGQLHRGGFTCPDGVSAPARGAWLRDLQHPRLCRRTARRRGLPAGDHRRRGGCRHRAGRGNLPPDPPPVAGLSDPRFHADDRHQRGGRGVRARPRLPVGRPGARVFGAGNRRDPCDPGVAANVAPLGGVRAWRAVRGVLRPMPHQRGTRRPLRQSGRMRPGMPDALRPPRRRPSRPARRPALPAQPAGFVRPGCHSRPGTSGRHLAQDRGPFESPGVRRRSDTGVPRRH